MTTINIVWDKHYSNFLKFFLFNCVYNLGFHNNRINRKYIQTMSQNELFCYYENFISINFEFIIYFVDTYIRLGQKIKILCNQLSKNGIQEGILLELIACCVIYIKIKFKTVFRNETKNSSIAGFLSVADIIGISKSHIGMINRSIDYFLEFCLSHDIIII